MSQTRTLFIYTETSLHAGTGTGLGAVDLPVQREAITSYPMIQSGGVKGAIRSQITGDSLDAEVVFGPMNPSDRNEDGSATGDLLFAGAASFGDARLLAFPVRSLRGVFVWITCPTVLARFRRDVDNTAFAEAPPPLPPEPAVIETEQNDRLTQAFVSSQRAVIQGDLVLEEYLYQAVDSTETTQWAQWLANYALPAGEVYDYFRQGIQERLVVLRDDDFRDFVLYSTQVITRIRMDPDKRTVVDGALFTQELLPAETLFYVPVIANKPRAPESVLARTSGFASDSNAAAVVEWLTSSDHVPGRIQIGGDETVGRGFVALRWGGQ